MAKNSRKNRKPPEDKQEMNLKRAKESLEEKNNALIIKQNEISNRESALVGKEADIKKLEEKNQELQSTLAKKADELNAKQLNLEEQELQAKNGYPDLFNEKFSEVKNQLADREKQCAQEWKIIEIEKGKLSARELEVKKAEIIRDESFCEERKQLEEELLTTLEKNKQKIVDQRKKLIEALEKEIEIERESKFATLEKDLSAERIDHDSSINSELEVLEKKNNAFAKKQAELDELKDECAYTKQRLQSRKDALDERESGLENEVDFKIIERKKSFEQDVAMLKDECMRLRESILTSNELVSNFEELKGKLGDEDPALVLLKLKNYEEEIADLRMQLATRPTKEMQLSFDRIKSERDDLEQTCERLSEENEGMREAAQQRSELEMQIAELKDKNKSLSRRFESIDADNTRLSEELKRLQSSYEREQDRENRIGDIETPYFQDEKSRNDEDIDEIEWLDRIHTSCMDYGLKFPKRILYAFHTALKTSEWSPVTVLAGVSGTGKSELPRLYSHFGGINFLNLSVQPNWDSQESMLGFFNSIDNKFDTQPVLRLLAQSQSLPDWLRRKLLNGSLSKSEKRLVLIIKGVADNALREKEELRLGYPGLGDTINLILMDEMNLSHVELYFADFLSKFELRRGVVGNEIPSLDVKLGAGVLPYDLPLGRNVLWVGTMNQDETTKSLSDKVLDRGIVINFPRPTTLERRKQLKKLTEPSPLLSRENWNMWWCTEVTFSDDQILPYKYFIEEMNTSLSKVGRALGHRVWQSIEYYISNYPDVLRSQAEGDALQLERSMKIAFEDQLVQKVMPKLRGIETRGKPKTECLDKIRSQLVDNDYAIVEDFDLAQEFGYGQFLWNSANYLKDDDIVEDKIEFKTKDNEEAAINSEILFSEDIPIELINRAKDQRKDIWNLNMKEIKTAMNCDAKMANQLKQMVNDMQVK